VKVTRGAGLGGLTRRRSLLFFDPTSFSAVQEGQEFGSPTSTGGARVAVRVHPTSDEDAKLASFDLEQRSISVVGEEDADFDVDRVFTPGDTQEDSVTRFCLPLVRQVVDGYSVSIIVLGATGSGTASCMWGRGADGKGGIVGVALDNIFEECDRQTRLEDAELVTKVSIVEVHNGKIRDMLVPVPSQRFLSIHSNPVMGVWVEDLSEATICSAAEAREALEFGLRMQRLLASCDPSRACRASMVMSLSVEIRLPSGFSRIGMVQFTLLAGVEQVRTPCGYAESGYLSQSLLEIKSLIKTQRPMFRLAVVPPSAGALALLLQRCLEGNSVSATVACVSACLPPGVAAATLEMAVSFQGLPRKPTSSLIDRSRVAGILGTEVERLKSELESTACPSPRDGEALLVAELLRNSFLGQLPDQSTLAAAQTENRRYALMRLGLDSHPTGSYLQSVSIDGVEGLLKFSLGTATTIGDDRTENSLVVAGHGLQGTLCVISTQSPEGAKLQACSDLVTVDGCQVLDGEEVALTHGVSLMLGRARFTFCDPKQQMGQPAESKGSQISLIDLRAALKAAIVSLPGARFEQLWAIVSRKHQRSSLGPSFIEDLKSAAGSVADANYLSKVMGKKLEFSLCVVDDVCGESGPFLGVACRDAAGCTVFLWSVDKLRSRLQGMFDCVEQVQQEGFDSVQAALQSSSHEDPWKEISPWEAAALVAAVSRGRSTTEQLIGHFPSASSGPSRESSVPVRPWLPPEATEDYSTSSLGNSLHRVLRPSDSYGDLSVRRSKKTSLEPEHTNTSLDYMIEKLTERSTFLSTAIAASLTDTEACSPTEDYSPTPAQRRRKDLVQDQRIHRLESAGADFEVVAAQIIERAQQDSSPVLAKQPAPAQISELAQHESSPVLAKQPIPADQVTLCSTYTGLASTGGQSLASLSVLGKPSDAGEEPETAAWRQGLRRTRAAPKAAQPPRPESRRRPRPSPAATPQQQARTTRGPGALSPSMTRSAVKRATEARARRASGTSTPAPSKRPTAQRAASSDRATRADVQSAYPSVATTGVQTDAVRTPPLAQQPGDGGAGASVQRDAVKTQVQQPGDGDAGGSGGPACPSTPTPPPAEAQDTNAPTPPTASAVRSVLSSPPRAGRDVAVWSATASRRSGTSRGRELPPWQEAYAGEGLENGWPCDSSSSLVGQVVRQDDRRPALLRKPAVNPPVTPWDLSDPPPSVTCNMGSPAGADVAGGPLSGGVVVERLGAGDQEGRDWAGEARRMHDEVTTVPPKIVSSRCTKSVSASLRSIGATHNFPRAATTSGVPGEVSPLLPARQSATAGSDSGLRPSPPRRPRRGATGQSTLSKCASSGWIERSRGGAVSPALMGRPPATSSTTTVVTMRAGSGSPQMGRRAVSRSPSPFSAERSRVLLFKGREQLGPLLLKETYEVVDLVQLGSRTIIQRGSAVVANSGLHARDLSPPPWTDTRDAYNQ